MTAGPPIRIVFVFAWLAVGGEETEVRLLARHLDRRRYRIDVIPCFRKEGMPDQTHDQLTRWASMSTRRRIRFPSRTRSPTWPAGCPTMTWLSPARTSPTSILPSSAWHCARR